MTLIDFDRAQLNVDDLLEGDVTLVSPPEVYAKLHRLMERPDSTIAMLAVVIEHDPALAARLLRIVNSAFFALPHKVHSIHDAVSMLGMRELKHLVLATEVIQRFRAIPHDLTDIYTYWHESLRSAVLARALAANSNVRLDVEAIFVAGLLHRIGDLVIYLRIPEWGRKALLESRYRHQPLHEAERAIMGFDHADVGAALARRWELPDLLCNVIAFQFEPERAGSSAPAAALVHLAVGAAQARSFAPPEVTAAMRPGDSPLWTLAGVAPDTLTAVLPEAEEAFHAALALIA